MTDLYAQIGVLGMRLADIDKELERVVAPLRAERALVQAEIDKVAAQIVGATSPVAAVTLPATDTAVPGTKPNSEAIAIPPRRRKLLNILAANAGADYGALCMKMYGRDDGAVRSTLSAEFSGLKADGFVELVDRGLYKLTDLGRRVTLEVVETR